jgi:hypothetical protein
VIVVDGDLIDNPSMGIYRVVLSCWFSFTGHPTAKVNTLRPFRV